MAKKEKKAKDPAKQALIREMLAMYKPETMADVEVMLLGQYWVLSLRNELIGLPRKSDTR
jgi:hypothetical protein